MYSFTGSIVSIFLELSHGSTVCHWNKKRGKSYADEQTNEADVRKPLVDVEGLRKDIRVAARTLAVLFAFAGSRSLKVTYPSKNVNNMM